MRSTSETTWIGTTEAASIIGVGVCRVGQLLREGRLLGRRLNPRSWMILRSDAERFASLHRPAGNPRYSRRKKKFKSR